VGLLLWYIFSVGGIVLALLGSSIWIIRRPGSLLARRVAVILAIAYAGLSVYPISHGIGRLLTSSYRPLAAADVPGGPSIIVLLGSNARTAESWMGDHLSVLDRESADRVAEAARLYRLLPNAWVISSGGLVDPRSRDEASAITMKQALLQMAVPESRILVEARSRNTREEAVIVGHMLASLRYDHVVLVTSALHMRRSVGAFRAAGIRVVPAIARNSRSPTNWVEWTLPTGVGFDEAALVAHEFAGLAYYALRGWYR
jgi:uncharacterized SAM-binding protein YcdF (DUF218 family)